MSITIREDVINSIIYHAEVEKPVEACGYLAGSGEIVTRNIAMTNADGSSEHFSLVPEEQFKAIRQLRKEGLKVMAIYHSHPQSPARMSQEDIRLAYDPDISYVIVSLENGAVVKSFRITGGNPVEEDIEIIQSTARGDRLPHLQE